jgi:penicillin amidase
VTKLARRVLRVLVAMAVPAVFLGLLAFGYGPVPPLGSALDPGHGAWTSVTGGVLPHSQNLDLPGLEHPASVAYTAQGAPTISAADDYDAYLAQGYVEATFRLAQMDLERRLGEGRLAQIGGSSYVVSDEFELQLGLERTAEEEWAQTPASSPAGQELLAFSQGVNDYLRQLRSNHDWPALFTLSGVYPANWSPVDSLVAQGVITQELSFTTAPLDYALLEQTLGAAKTMAWFPVDSANQPTPYDPGPHPYLGVTPVAPDLASSAPPSGSVNGGEGTAQAAAGTSPDDQGAGPVTQGSAQAASVLLAEVGQLPAGQVHEYPDSNAWAANGPKVAGGGAMLAGDPHLPLTLPSTWFQLALDAPGLTVSGVNFPGEPGILIGHNAHISWSITDVQDQTTLFYAEQTSPSHPGEYYWRGQWRPMQQVHYTIPVRGGPSVPLTVDITVHGPIMTQAGQTMAVDWMGNVPSPDLSVMSQISQAGDFTQFRAALADWKAPTENFVYADDSGNIGAISAGYYPQVAHGDPWLPLSGAGAGDVTGVIPYAAVPQVYDPPGHVIASANQRPVGASYPYYIGTSADFFDPGYRASEIYAYLGGHSDLTAADFAALQNSVTDPLASEIVPVLLKALRGAPGLNQAERSAAQQLAGWNDAMAENSSAAAIWFTFWSDYLSAVFQPWWTAAHVPVATDPSGLEATWQQPNLDEDLQEWTLADPANPAFSSPGHSSRTAVQAMRAAFAATVAQLSAKFGDTPATWTWGDLHSTQIPSKVAGALGYGPLPASGDLFTVNSADGYPVSTQGPSWRMIVTWTGSEPVSAEGIYPGGQSENPASPWYTNMLADWSNGDYLPMPPAGSNLADDPIRWLLLPGGG